MALEDFEKMFRKVEDANEQGVENVSFNEKKAVLIPIEQFKENVWNTRADSSEDIITFAKKIRSNAQGVLEPVVAFLDDDGKYTLISGHKRYKACMYNIDHERMIRSEEENPNIVRGLYTIIVPKPFDWGQNLELITDYNDYRKYTTQKARFELFKTYFYRAAYCDYKGDKIGRLYKWIAEKSGLGETYIRKCLKDYYEGIICQIAVYRNRDIDMSLEEYIKQYNHITEDYIVTYTLKKVKKYMKEEREEISHENRETVRLKKLGDDFARKINAQKCRISSKGTVTISFRNNDDLNEFLNRNGLIEDI